MAMAVEKHYIKRAIRLTVVLLLSAFFVWQGSIVACHLIGWFLS